MPQATERSVDRVGSSEKRKERRAADAELNTQSVQPFVSRLDPQPIANGTYGDRPFAGEQMNARQLQITVGQEKVELEGVAAERDAVGDSPFAKGEAITQVGVVERGQIRALETVRKVDQLGEPTHPIAAPTELDRGV